jgi:uncharacterized membrane protein
MSVSKARSLAKALTWRTTGTIDTFLISFLITKQPLVAGAIASTEVVTKIFLYYFHERVWNRVKWGRLLNQPIDKKIYK